MKPKKTTKQQQTMKPKKTTKQQKTKLKIT